MTSFFFRASKSLAAINTCLDEMEEFKGRDKVPGTRLSSRVKTASSYKGSRDMCWDVYPQALFNNNNNNNS